MFSWNVSPWMRSLDLLSWGQRTNISKAEKISRLSLCSVALSSYKERPFARARIGEQLTDAATDLRYSITYFRVSSYNSYKSWRSVAFSLRNKWHLTNGSYNSFPTAMHSSEIYPNIHRSNSLICWGFMREKVVAEGYKAVMRAEFYWTANILVYVELFFWWSATST